MKSLLDLLPKGGNSVVDTLDNELKFFRRFLFLIQEAEEGIQHFLQGNLSHFDPHVGDTACQIRACYFSCLWIDRQKIFLYLKRDMFSLRTYAEKCALLLDQGVRNSHRSLRPCFLSEFLDQVNLNLDLENVSLNIVISHLLSKYAWIDEKKMPQFVDQKLLQTEMNESVAFCKSFFRHLQKQLSRVSVEFIIFLSKSLESSGVKLNSSGVLLPALLKQDSYERDQLPCIAVFDVISNFLARTQKIDCVLIVDFVKRHVRESFVFKLDQSGKWAVLSVENLVGENPIFLIRACSGLSSKEKLLSCCSEFGIDNILRWFGAAHPQYSGIFEYFFPNKYQLFFEENLRAASFHAIGLMSEEAGMLAIKHILVCEQKEILKKILSLPMLYHHQEVEISNIF